MMQGSDHQISKMHNRDGNDRHTHLQFIFDNNMFKQHSKPLLSLSIDEILIGSQTGSWMT